MDPIIFSVRILTTGELPMYAGLVRSHSWGEDYPVNPMDEISTAEQAYGLLCQGEIVGGCYLHKKASPDEVEDAPIWFAGAVISPAYRGKGGLRILHNTCIGWLRTNGCKTVAACTDNPLMVGFFEREGWRFNREAIDEGGGAAKIFTLKVG